MFSLQPLPWLIYYLSKHVPQLYPNFSYGTQYHKLLFYFNIKLFSHFKLSTRLENNDYRHFST